MKYLRWILMMLERLASCFGFSRRKAEEERKRVEKERIQRNVRHAVRLTQHSEFITREQLEEIRKENLAHNFLDSK